MTKAVFQQSSHSDYLDRPGEVYHFPNRQYLSVVRETVGDWVVFYEGRAGGWRGYYAVQRVARVEPDPADPTRSFAIMDRGSLLEFPNPQPRERPDGRLYESGLAQMGGNNSSAVRRLPEADFAAIVDAALGGELTADDLPRQPDDGFAEPAAAWLPPTTDRARLLSSRAVRDAAFSRNVRRAYQGRCAMSGLELRNGGGRPEVEAAHIRAVEDDGPDTVLNGMALSGTLHWMFDRGLLSVDEDARSILVAQGSIAAEIADRLLTPDRKLILPPNPRLAPHSAYLDWHRNQRFKG